MDSGCFSGEVLVPYAKAGFLRVRCREPAKVCVQSPRFSRAALTNADVSHLSFLH